MRTLTLTLIATLCTLVPATPGRAQFSTPPGGKFSGGNGTGTQLPHYVGGYLGSSPGAGTMGPSLPGSNGINANANLQNPFQSTTNLPRNAWQLQEYFNPNSMSQNPFSQNPFGPTPFNQNPLNANQFGPFPGNSFNQNPFNQNPLNQNPFNQNPFIQSPFNQNPLNQNPFNPQVPNTFGWNNFNNPAFGNAFQPNVGPFGQPNAGALKFGMANQFPQLFLPPFR